MGWEHWRGGPLGYKINPIRKRETCLTGHPLRYESRGAGSGSQYSARAQDGPQEIERN